MNDAEFEIEKGRLRAFEDKWIDTLGLGPWELTFCYQREAIADSEDLGGDAWGTMARTSMKWEYQQAQLTYDCGMTAELSDDAAERVIVHELCHVLVSEMRPVNQKNWERQHEERVVTLLAESLLRARRPPLVNQDSEKLLCDVD